MDDFPDNSVLLFTTFISLAFKNVLAVFTLYPSCFCSCFTVLYDNSELGVISLNLLLSTAVVRNLERIRHISSRFQPRLLLFYYAYVVGNFTDLRAFQNNSA